MKDLILLLIAMSAAGTLPFIIYIVLSTIFDNFITARFRYRCLKYCMILYLIPFPLLKYFVCRYVSTPKPLTGDVVISLTGKIIQTSNGFYLNSMGCFQKIFIGLWICSLCVVIFYEIITFIRFHRKISQNELSDSEVLRIVEMISKEMKLHRKVTVYENNFVASPFTYGAFHPSIVLTSFSNKNDLYLIIRHELQHIKSYDFLFRQLAFLVLILHCYNPLVFFFFREVKEVQELACDENVMKYLSKEEQKCYGYLLIMTAAKEGSEMKYRITLMFSKNNRNFLKRRIQKIGTFVKPKLVLNVSIIIFMISISCVPVFAYNPPTADLRSVPWTGFFDPAEGAQVTVFDNGNEIEYTTYNDESDTVSSDEKYFKYTDAYFITENGKIIIMGQADLQTQASCSHTFIYGTVKKHYPDNKGGCSIKIYKGNICTKCNYAKNLSFVNTLTYLHCPH